MTVSVAPEELELAVLKQLSSSRISSCSTRQRWGFSSSSVPQAEVISNLDVIRCHGVVTEVGEGRLEERGAGSLLLEISGKLHPWNLTNTAS